MYKSKVQELCQKKSWSLPDYQTQKIGPLHNPAFTSTVTVNGLQFNSPEPTRSAKEAQNIAAKLAFDHFSQPIDPNPDPDPDPDPDPNPNPNPNPNPFPQLPSLPGCYFPQPSFSLPAATSPTSIGSSGPTNGGVDTSVLQPRFEVGSQTSQISSTVTATIKNDMLHMYKNQLQTYAQKSNLDVPVYFSESEGPPHALRFKCKVTINGQTFESPKLFSTLKDAEHAAAEAALMSLSPGGVQEDLTGLYKNLLQELVRKEGFGLPSYNTNKYGEAHMPIFVSQVEIKGESFTGQEAKSKKLAEISAAKVAYMTLKERKGMSDQSSLVPLSAHQGQAPEFSSDRSEANVITGLQHYANPKSPASLGLVSQNQPGKDKEPVVVTEKKRSYPAGNTNGCTEKSSLSNVQCAPSLSESINLVSDNSNMPSAEINSPSQRKKVVVYSCNTNVTIEVGGTLMPISDDKWVAYSYSD